MKNESDLIAKRYAKRKNISNNRYSMLNPSVWMGVQERQRALIKILNSKITKPLKDITVLEIGCGGGANLLELMRLGFSPEKLIGNELLPERINILRKNLPSLCKIEEGDASLLEYADESLDLIYQSTVFTSLLDDKFQEKLAKKMWEWVTPGGGIIWYDFIYNNPSNKDVRGVPLSRVKTLFPDAIITTQRVTLAPPLSRRVTKIHPSLYTIVNTLFFLRTHVLCYIQKNHRN